MLKRNRRLSNKDRLEEISKEGVEFKSRALICRCLPNTAGFNRYAVVISSKLEKSAVKRNRLRRQIFETIRSFEKEDGHEKKDAKTATFDIMLFARKALLNRSFPEIQNAVCSILTNAHEPK